MKKKILIITIFITILTLVGCGNKLKTYETINYSDLDQKLEEKQDFVLFIGAKTCSACKIYKETLNQVIKDYQVKIYYIDVEALSGDDYSKFYSKFSFSGTPTTIFIEKGQETTNYNRIEGSKDYETIVEKLKKNGYIKEDH